MDESLSRYRRFYTQVVELSKSPYALLGLTAVSFADGSFFPVPPFALLIPMVAAQPRRWWSLALLGTVSSFFGGMLGYYLGLLIHDGATNFLHIDLNAPLRIGILGIDSTLGRILGDKFWILALLCSLLPTPFKVVAIGSGMVQVPFTRFLLGAAIGRPVRFFAASGVTAWLAIRALKLTKLDVQEPAVEPTATLSPERPKT